MKSNKQITPILLDAYSKAKKLIGTPSNIQIVHNEEVLNVPAVMIDVGTLWTLLEFISGEFELEESEEEPEEDSLGFGIVVEDDHE